MMTLTLMKLLIYCFRWQGWWHLLGEVLLKFWWSETKAADGATIQAG